MNTASEHPYSASKELHTSEPIPNVKQASKDIKDAPTIHESTAHPVAPPQTGGDENVSGYFIPGKAKNLVQLLDKTTVDEVLAHKGQIASIESSSTVRDALTIIRDVSVISLPVYAAETHNFIGMCDTRDILSYLCSLDKDSKGQFHDQKIGALTEISKTSPTPTVLVGTPLSEALKKLSHGTNHRVGVVAEHGAPLSNIVSQMSLVHFIAKNISLLDPEFAQLKVSKFMKPIQEIFTLPSDTRTDEAFQYLYLKGVSAAAVVDVITGSLIDTISCTDLVGLLHESGVENLNLPVADYLSKTRRTKSIKPPIVCSLNDSFESVILKLSATAVHRIWVVDDVDQRYLGFVNLTDILQALQQLVA